MRQIHVCAWLVITSLSAVACSGEQFTTGDQGNGNSSGSSENGDTSPARNEAASSGDDDNGSATDSGGNLASGGTSSTGGSSPLGGGTGMASAGNKSSGGEAGTASNADCLMGAVKLKMVPDPGLPPDYLCDAGCGTGWLTITDAKGATAFSLFPACGNASCESCSPLPCAAAACLPTPLTADGSALTWDGSYLAADTCGMNVACQRPACVAPGRYKAKACAAINGGANDMAAGACTPKSTQLCAEAEFDFPESAEVTLVLRK